MQEQGDEVVLTLAGESRGNNRFGKAGVMPHPIAVFFHVAFKISALLAYLFCGWFSGSFITSFIVVVLLLSMDFWTTKNITGRLLAGLRWWNQVDEEGKSHWVFESRGQNESDQSMFPLSSTEVNVFWSALVFAQTLWGFFFIASLFTLSLRWLLLVVVAFCLNGANLYGYIQCRIGAKRNVSDAAKGILATGFMNSIASRFLSSTSAANKPAAENATFST